MTKLARLRVQNCMVLIEIFGRPRHIRKFNFGSLNYLKNSQTIENKIYDIIFYSNHNNLKIFQV